MGWTLGTLGLSHKDSSKLGLCDGSGGVSEHGYIRNLIRTFDESSELFPEICLG